MILAEKQRVEIEVVDIAGLTSGFLYCSKNKFASKTLCGADVCCR